MTPLPSSPPGRVVVTRPSGGVAGSAAGEGGDEHGLDGVQPVLGLVEHHRVRTLEHLVGHLEAVEPRALEERLADGPARPSSIGG
jgi:hypothetical protein